MLGTGARLPTVRFWDGSVLDGLTSVPLVAAYSRWYAAHVAEHPSTSEAEPTIMSRLRITRRAGDRTGGAEGD